MLASEANGCHLGKVYLLMVTPLYLCCARAVLHPDNYAI